MTDDSNRIAPDEDAAFVLSQAEELGWTISRSQLERRHRAGLIPRPRQHARGRGAGTVTIYPAGTVGLLIEGLELGRNEMPLRQVAFELWLRGRPISKEAVREQLAGIARLHDRLAIVVRALGFGRRVLPSKALRFVEDLAAHRTTALTGSMRKRLGRQERFQTLLRTSIEIAGGAYQAPERIFGDADDEGLLVEIALGFERARSEAPIGVQPWLQGRPTDALVAAAEWLGGDWGRDLKLMTDDHLEIGRGRWMIVQDLTLVVEELREIYGGDAFGLAALTDALRLGGVMAQTAAVFILARDASRADSWGPQFDMLREACAKWRRDVSPQLHLLRTIRSFDPTAQLFGPDRLHAVLTDSSARATWMTEARQLSVRYEAQLRGILEGVNSRQPSIV